MALKGRRFNDVEEIQAESQAALDDVQKEESQKWENRCITAQGEYFEGDNFNYCKWKDKAIFIVAVRELFDTTS
jgi:hypothetical protein